MSRILDLDYWRKLEGLNGKRSFLLGIWKSHGAQRPQTTYINIDIQPFKDFILSNNWEIITQIMLRV